MSSCHIALHRGKFYLRNYRGVEQSHATYYRRQCHDRYDTSCIFLRLSSKSAAWIIGAFPARWVRNAVEGIAVESAYCGCTVR